MTPSRGRRSGTSTPSLLVQGRHSALAIVERRAGDRSCQNQVGRHREPGNNRAVCRTHSARLTFFPRLCASIALSLLATVSSLAAGHGPGRWVPLHTAVPVQRHRCCTIRLHTCDGPHTPWHDAMRVQRQVKLIMRNASPRRTPRRQARRPAAPRGRGRTFRMRTRHMQFELNSLA
jgi:hypothetical protein